MKCIKCGYFGSTFNRQCPYCESDMEWCETSWTSMYGYEVCINKEKVCISKIGHSDSEDGFLTMSRHTFEKFIKFYEKQKEQI